MPVNQPGSAYYNDDDALVATLRQSKSSTERKQTYRHFATELKKELSDIQDLATSFPRAWGLLVTWIKEQRQFAPLSKPLATYLLSFLRITDGNPPANTRKYRYRYIPKRALIEMAPNSVVCREGIARRFAESCFRILKKYFPDQQEHPEEIYGEAITDLFANLPRRQEPETASMFTYFMVIAKRKYSRYLKVKQRHPAPVASTENWEAVLRQHDSGYTEEPLDFADVLAECQAVVAQKFVFNNEGELVKKLLLLLKPTYREALQLRFLEEMDYAEIAKQLDCTPENARTRVHRGLNKLRQLLNRQA